MKVLTSSVLAAISVMAASAMPIGDKFVPLSSRAASDTDGFLNSLRQNNLTRIADVLSQNTIVTDAIFADNQAKLFLAPSNDAVDRLPSWVTNNQTKLQATLLQHVVKGSFNSNNFNLYPLHTVGHTLLTNPDYVNLPGGAGQAIALSKSYGVPFVSEAANNDTLLGNQLSFNRITVQPIEQAVTIPGSLIQTLEYLRYDGLVSQINQIQDGALVRQLDQMPGITVFAPTNRAINDFLANQPNSNDLATILGQHVIPSRVIYSPLLLDQGSMITSSGQDLRFDNNAGTVTVNGQTARIVQTDILCKTGVIHRIDKVLASTALDTNRAAQAQKSSVESVDVNAIRNLQGAVSGKNAITSQGNSVPKSQDGSNLNHSANDNSNNSAEGVSTTGVDQGTNGNGSSLPNNDNRNGNHRNSASRSQTGSIASLLIVIGATIFLV